MIAVRFSLSWKKHMEQLQSSFNYLDRHFTRSYKAWKKHMEQLQSSFNYLDRHFTRSYKAKKNRNVIS